MSQSADFMCLCIDLNKKYNMTKKEAAEIYVDILYILCAEEFELGKFKSEEDYIKKAEKILFNN